MLKRILFCTILVGNIACYKSDSSEEKVKQSQNIAAIKASVDSIISKYNAISGWETRGGDVMLNAVYTADIEDILIDTSRRPILFYGTLEDLEPREQGYIARLSPYYYDGIGELVNYQLTCDELTKQQIFVPLSDREWESGLAVVCSLERVEKLRFAVDAETYGKGEDKYGEISVQYSPAEFLATGKVLGAVHIKNLWDYMKSIEQKGTE